MHFQGSRMDDQRCSLPQIPANQCSSKQDKSASDLGPARSASFSPSSDIERLKSQDKASQKQVYDQVTAIIFNAGR